MTGKPLPSATPEEAPESEPASEESTSEEETEEESTEEEETSSKPPLPPAPEFKLSTFILVFLFLLGIWMLFDQSARNQIAVGIGSLLYPVIGFGGTDPLLTMFLAGVIQMTVSAIAYNFTTDWVESAKVQAHSKAIRPLQMAAIRSGKKHQLEALKPHMDDLSARQSKMMIGQLKGMAVTWFLLIAIYTWVGIFLDGLNPNHTAMVILFGTNVNLMGMAWIMPVWFLVFSMYTLPLNLVLRRFLKHQSLSQRLGGENNAAGASPPPAAG